MPPPTDGTGGRRIRGGALIDLQGLQALLRSGEFDLDKLWFATSGARNDREKYEWSSAQVLDMLLDLHGPHATPNDYWKSEWCEVDAEVGMRWVACDVYRMNYDLERFERTRDGTQMYFKFSLDEDGFVTIVLASCHPSR